MRLFVVLIAVVALVSAQTLLQTGPNRTATVTFGPGYIQINGTRYSIPNSTYTWINIPSSSPSRAVVGLSYPFSACSLSQQPTSFLIQCPENHRIIVVYAASPGYSLYCDQQPTSQQAEGLVRVLEFNVLRLSCSLSQSSLSANVGPYGPLVVVLGSATIALSVTIAGLILAMIIKQREGGASSQ